MTSVRRLLFNALSLLVAFLFGCNHDSAATQPPRATSPGVPRVAPEEPPTAAGKDNPLLPHREGRDEPWRLRLRRWAFLRHREMELREVWKCRPAERRWVLTPVRPQSVPLRPPNAADAQLYTLPLPFDVSEAVPPGGVGLLYVKWALDGSPGASMLYLGDVIPNDLEIGDPPPGMIATGVPAPDGAFATFVPDPRLHCVTAEQKN